MSTSGDKKSPSLEEIQTYYCRTYRDRPVIAAIGELIGPNWYPVIVSNWPICEGHPMYRNYPDLISLGYNNILMVFDSIAGDRSMTLRFC